MLAKGGLTGPLTIFEGKYGMVRMLARKDDATPIIERLGEDFGVMHVEFKYHPVNISIQSPINLLSELVQTHDIRPSQVERIDVGCRTEHSLTHVGAIYEPKDVLGAQFSMPFSLALRVVKRSNDLKLYTDPSVWRDPEVLGLAHRVHLHFDPRLAAHKRPGEAHGYGCHIKVTLTDERVLENEEEYQKGNPKKPLTAAEAADKFHRLASLAFPGDRIEKIISAVRRLDNLEDPRELTSLLVPEK
jgi:2-methylcitrate dehydratase PrpD